MSPVLYLPHGGGPLPLLGEPGHASMVEFLKKIPVQLGSPAAILVISAHWEESTPVITSGLRPELIFDYYGFPPETYQYAYPAPGLPELAENLHSILSRTGMNSKLDPQRGFDHGLFIPLMIMYPEATIPCVQISLLNSLDPAEHIQLGKHLSVLREQNVLIIGSGLSYHNMGGFSDHGDQVQQHNAQFDQWLVETCCNQDLSYVERERRLIEWEQGPSSRHCHPREEHLLPLHVCFGASKDQSFSAELVYHDKVMGKMASGFLWN